MSIPMTGDDWRNEATAELFDAILRLESRDEAAAFFRDLCTRRELEEMSHRWAVVRKLAAGLPYRQIHDETGVSTATITRINQWLQHGAGGYRRMLDKLGDDGSPAAGEV
jgi:TrpR-related protein YerC/YecD